jgi:hypothetical protein
MIVPMSRLAVLLCLTACAEPPPPVGVYSEFIAYDALDAQLPALAEHQTRLTVAVQSARIGDASLAGLLRAADERHVRVRLWLVLAVEDGYWPNEANLDRFIAEVERLLEWVDREGLAIEGVVYDLEPAYAYSEELRAAFADGFDAVEPLVRAHRDPIAFEQSRARLAEHVAEVQARGYGAFAVTYPQVVDDLEDGDDDLQDGLDIPVRGVGFDEVSFMVYQTVIAEAAGTGWIGPGLVRAYAADASRYFGASASIALGIVGSASIVPISGPLYDTPAALAQDVAAARAEGVARIEIYSLDGMVELGGPAAWLSATSAEPGTFPIPTEVHLVRGAANGLDAALD